MTDEPQICYLVLAHRAPHQLARLVNALEQSGEVLVHIDRSVDQAPFARALHPGSRADFVARRFGVRWSGMSMCRATMALVDGCLVGTSATRLVLLSADSYPLADPERIRAFFLEHSARDQIDLRPVPPTGDSEPRHRLTSYYIEQRRDNLAMRAVNRGLAAAVRRDYLSAFEGLVPHWGPQWWSLRRSTVERMRQLALDHPRLLRFCAHTRVPDEQLFHTLAAAAVPSDEIEPSVVYSDFSRPTPPWPAVLTVSDLRGLAAGAHRPDPWGREEILFARKLPEDGDIEIAFAQRHLWGLPIG